MHVKQRNCSKICVLTLVEGLHAVVLALGDVLVQQVGLFGVADGVLDVAGRHHHLHGGDQAGAVRPREQPLRDHGPQRLRETHPHHRLLRHRKDREHALDGLGGVGGVRGGEHQMPGLGRLHGDVDGLGVAHLADHDDVRVLAQCRAQGAGEGIGVGADLALHDGSALVPEEELDGILDGDHVGGARVIDLADHPGERGGLATSGGARHQDQAALLGGQFRQHGGKVQIAQPGHVEGDHAHHDRHAAPLAEGVHPEAADPGHGEGEVELSELLGVLFREMRRQQGAKQPLGVVRLERRSVQGLELAANAEQHLLTGLEVNVRRPGLEGGAQDSLDGGAVDCLGIRGAVHGRYLDVLLLVVGREEIAGVRDGIAGVAHRQVGR